MGSGFIDEVVSQLLKYTEALINTKISILKQVKTFTKHDIYPFVRSERILPMEALF